MKVGFVIQRYGTEILGGAEYSARLLAERLAPRHQVEVLTTCARDYVTWANEYPEGTDRVRGVNVRRFASARTRDIAEFNRYSDWIFNNPHTRQDEMEWLRQQGPWCPALQEYLEKNAQNYDLLVFFTYLYAPTVLGLKVDPARSILVPTAHDEPAIHLEIFKDVFGLPAGVLGLGTAGSAITGAIGGGGGQGAIRAGGTARLKQAWRAGEAAPRRVAPTCIAR